MQPSSSDSDRPRKVVGIVTPATTPPTDPPDFEQAAHFLTLLDETAEYWTFQTFDDLKARKDPDLARVLHGTLKQHWQELCELSSRGAGVFVTVNETNGKGRKTADIIRVRAVFQECDRPGTPEPPLQPHIVVESSPGKFHRHLLVDGANCFDLFELVMARLVQDFGSDPNAKDRARVLRLPGFPHQKDPARPWTVRIIYESGEQPYSWDDITAKIPPLVIEKKSADIPPGKGIENPAKVRSALAALNPDMDYLPWLQVGMALHHATAGGAEGLQLWDEWSARGSLYRQGEPAEKWRSFNTTNGRPVTLATVFKWATENSWRWKDPPKKGNGQNHAPPNFEQPPIECYEGDYQGDNKPESHFSNFSNFSSGGRKNSENASSAYPWDDPQPLRREPPPPEPFPIAALGDVLNKAALAMMEVIQSPAAICANSLLAGSALAVQGHADIVIDGRTFPISGYFATVADSGERKTATDDATLKPHAKRQRALREIYDREIQEHTIRMAAWKKTRDEALSSKRNKTMQAKADALYELGPEPQGPIDAILMVEEPTYEGLIKALANGYPSMGLFSDEGGRFLGGHGMNQENQLKTAAGLSKLWDGSPISRTRGGDGNILLYGRRLSVHLMIQPAVSALLFGNALLMGQGLLSRFLVAWPESNIGKHRYRESNLAESPAMRRYFGRLLDILEAPLPLMEGSRNELAPRQLPLSPEAKRIWIDFHDYISELCGEKKALHAVKGLAAKGAEHAARLAGLLTLVRDLHAGEVAAVEMESGIELTQFYLGEALRLFEATADSPDLILAEKCLAWARTRDCPLTLPDLYQFGPNQVRDKETAKKIVGMLENHGWVRPIPGGADVGGKRRRSAWEVKP